MRRSVLVAALRWVHRWIALTLGTVLTAIALSGSLLYFQPQFFRWAHGEMIPERPIQTIGSIDQWVANAKIAAPGLEGPVAIWAPHVHHNISDVGMVLFRGLEPGRFGESGWLGVLVSPDDGKVLGSVAMDDSPAYIPLLFHVGLLASATGEWVEGIVAIGTLLLLLLGLYLWWPSRDRLLRKLSLRPLRKLALALPLHEWLGIWSLLVLFVLTATGLHLIKPSWVEPVLIAAAGPPQEGVRPELRSLPCDTPIGFDAAIARARDLVPGGTLTAIEPRYDWQKLRPWQIVFSRDDSLAHHREVQVYADLDCGIVALDSTPQSRPRREYLEQWLDGLHDGRAAGRFGQVAVTFAGLIPLVMLWSGFRMWLRRRNWLAR